VIEDLFYNQSRQPVDPIELAAEPLDALFSKLITLWLELKKMTPVGVLPWGRSRFFYRVKDKPARHASPRRPETSNGFGGNQTRLDNLNAEQMQEKLASALHDGRRHLVTVRKGERGRLDIQFAPELGDVERAFVEAWKSAPNNRPS
jgi:hypothetical protein